MSRKPTEPKPLVAADGGALFDVERKAMLASQCTLCGRRHFPQRPICVDCGVATGMEQIVLSRRGTVYASTVIRVRSALGHEPPYAYGYADLDGLQVFTRFSGDPPESFQPGDAVELAFENLHGDAQGELLIHVFRKVLP